MSWSRFLALQALLLGSVLHPQSADAQAAAGMVRVRAVSDDGPVSEATIRSGDVGGLTNDVGEAVLRLPVGTQVITVEKLGFADEIVSVEVASDAETMVGVVMTEQAEEIEGIVVLSTRSGRRIEDEPVRVEVLALEEIEEKVLMTPGDIAMMLNETSGLRVQNTSPSLGGSNVRIQGLRGRYTQILADGLPLYGGQSGSLSMLQIPPMDLGQVEVIKGAASALYGSSALGGVINLISRRPAGERDILLNQTSLGGTDGVLWLSDELAERWGYTLLGGLHRQGQADVDEDGWSDVPAYRRAVLRPRLFWDDGAGRTLLVTVGTTVEDREGGTRSGRLTPAGTEYPERLETRRADVGALGSFLIGGNRVLTLRASAMGQRHEHLFGDALERDLHANIFGELAYGGTASNHTWLIGTALQHESYEAEDVSGFDFGYTIPSLFLQDEYAPSDWITLAASGRIDSHSEFGAFFNPRISLLLRPGEWTARASAGTGFFAPTPFTEETEAVGLARLAPLAGLAAERARSASLDIGRTMGALEANATLFGSIVDDPVQATRAGATLTLVNAEGPTRTWGGELLARWDAEPFFVTATYTHLRSTESDPESTGVRRDVPLTPRHAAGIVAMWEREGESRVGWELYYTGRQELEENPYRTASRPYFLTGLLVEHRIGDARVFVNAENILDTRQTAYDPLVLPSRSPEGRWTTDAWAPLEGRVFNAGVRYEF